MFSQKNKIKLFGKAIFLAACFCLFFIPYTISATKNLIIDANASISDEKISSLVNDLNAVRDEFNLPHLIYSAELTKLAKIRLDDMRGKKYIDHVNPDGQDLSGFTKKINYNYLYIGENLAINYQKNQDIIQAWLDSPAHRDNLLNGNYNELGLAFGYVSEKGESKYVTVLILGQEKQLSFKNLVVK